MYTYSKEILTNGLRVIYIEMPHIHSVVMSAYIGVGSRYEEERQESLARRSRNQNKFKKGSFYWVIL